MKATTPGFNPDYAEDAPELAEVEAQPGPLVLEFGAPWCGWCQGATPYIRDAFSSFPAVPHTRVYDGKGRRLGRTFRVKLWPTLIFLRDGREVARVVRPADAAPLRDALAAITSST